MTPERWGEVKELFRAALERPVEERAGYLDETCGGDDALRTEVESLLASYQDSDSILDRPVSGAAARLVGAAGPGYRAGDRVGRYEIVAPVGEGGMGMVYRARDLTLGRDVALKFLHDDFGTDPGRMPRFEREARAVAALSHPHIVALHDIGREDGTTFLVMELLTGETLAARLARGALPLPEAIALGVQVAEALAAAHRLGIVHRDLKPGNVMLTRGGAKLLDFGIAKQRHPSAAKGAGWTHLPTVAATARTPLTAEGSLIGTLQYMAPEQLEGKEIDARADLFAFGAMLYEMVSGRPAFAGTNPASVIASILKDQPRPLVELVPLTPPTLDRLVERCLAKDPEERWQSAADVAEGLRWVGADATAATPVQPSPRARQRRRLATAAVGLLVAGIAFTGGMLVRKGAVGAVPSGGANLAAASQLSFAQRTFGPQTVFNARFAPDGRTIVYSSALRGSRPELFVLRPEYPEPQSLGLAATHLLAVSPRGELAVLTGARWVRHRLFTGTLARVPLGGGAPREVAPGVREADWTPDGAELAVIREMEGRDRVELPLGKVLHQAVGYLSDPRVSPDGRGVAFVEHPRRWDDRGFVALVDRAGRVTKLSSVYTAVEGLAWSDDGSEVCYGAHDGNLLQAFCAQVGARPRLRLATAGDIALQDISKAGRWLVTLGKEAYSIRVRAPGAAEERDLSWLESGIANDISRDGRMLLLTEHAGSHYTVIVRGTDGSPPVRLGEGEGGDFSRDRQLVSATVFGEPPQALVYSVGVGSARRLDRGEFDHISPQVRWFPDMATMLLCGAQRGRPTRCYRREVGDGSLRAITPEGSRRAWISPQGDRILLWLVDGSYGIMASGGGGVRPVGALDPNDRAVRWSPDGNSIWLCREDVPQRLEAVDLATGRRRLLRELVSGEQPGLLSIVSCDISDDPSVYAYTRQDYLSQLFEVEGLR